MQRNSDGTFKRTRFPFSLDNFNDGWIDSEGRFRVYSPNHPRADIKGYILRAIVAYELYHNIQVPETMAIHHIDKNRLNDSKENLVMMLFSQHSSFHNKPRREASLVSKRCKTCGKEFLINKWRLKDPTRGQYCSSECYHQAPFTDMHKKLISTVLKQAYRDGRRKKRGNANDAKI